MADKVCSADASTGPLYHCEICGRDFKHPGNYKQHMSSHMRTVSSVGPRPPSLHSPSVPSPPSNPLLANRKPTPSATVTSNSSAAATFPKGKGVSGGSLKCEICDQVFESQIALYSHKQSRHAPTPLVSSDPLGARSLVTANGESVLANMYPCDEDNCFESFSKEGWLSKHKEQAHGKAYVASARGRLSCPICQKNFDRRKKLHRHMKVHRYGPNAVCLIALTFDGRGRVRTVFIDLFSTLQSTREALSPRMRHLRQEIHATASCSPSQDAPHGREAVSM